MRSIDNISVKTLRNTEILSLGDLESQNGKNVFRMVHIENIVFLALSFQKLSSCLK